MRYTLITLWLKWYLLAHDFCDDSAEVFVMEEALASVHAHVAAIVAANALSVTKMAARGAYLLVNWVMGVEVDELYIVWTANYALFTVIVGVERSIVVLAPSAVLTELLIQWVVISHLHHHSRRLEEHLPDAAYVGSTAFSIFLQ
jgi:Flp pilus assembly protein TadB